MQDPGASEGSVFPRHIFLKFAQFASRDSGATVCVHLLLPRDSPDTGPVACTSCVLHGQLLSSPAPLLYLGSCLDMSNKLSGEGRWSTLCQEEASLVQPHLTALGSLWIFFVGNDKVTPKTVQVMLTEKHLWGRRAELAISFEEKVLSSNRITQNSCACGEDIFCTFRI